MFEFDQVGLLGRGQSSDTLQVEHLVGHPDESQDVTTVQDGVGSDRCDHLTLAIEGGEEHPLEMAKTAGFDRLSVEGAGLIDHHVEDEPLGVVFRLLSDRPAYPQQPRGEQDEQDTTHDRYREPDTVISKNPIGG